MRVPAGVRPGKAEVRLSFPGTGLRVEDRELDLADASARLNKAVRDAAVVETDLQYAVIKAPMSRTMAMPTRLAM